MGSGEILGFVGLPARASPVADAHHQKKKEEGEERVRADAHRYGVSGRRWGILCFSSMSALFSSLNRRKERRGGKRGRGGQTRMGGVAVPRFAPPVSFVLSGGMIKRVALAREREKKEGKRAEIRSARLL